MLEGLENLLAGGGVPHLYDITAPRCDLSPGLVEGAGSNRLLVSSSFTSGVPGTDIPGLRVFAVKGQQPCPIAAEAQVFKGV